ncbi:MAG: site-specific DNA-methyltransferase [Thermoproteota archaeon]|nr:site-specific DNA-methyltransferase [Thermoproteota archaeon]
MKLKSENLSQIELAKIKNLYTLDWELEDADTRYYTHGFHRYSAKYIPQIPYRLISKFTKKNDLVLDNFMGSGTTLVESKVLGRNAIGIDVNPLACLISKVKTTTIQKSTLLEISKILILLKEDIINLRGNTLLFNHREIRPTIENSMSKTPLHPNISKWYHQNVIYELLVIKSRIDTVENKDVKDFLLVSLSSILRSVSNAMSGFGNLMINKQAPPKTRIYEKFVLAVKDMLKNMSEYNKAATNSNIRIVNHDSRRLEFINDETIDFICTHPPYMAAIPYAEYQKLSLWWLGFSQYELEKRLIGGRRSRADTPDRFFHDINMALMEMKRILRKKKYCCIIIGNPVYNGKIWKLNDFIRKDASDIGFILLTEINRGKYRSTMGKMKEEFILIFRNE